MARASSPQKGSAQASGTTLVAHDGVRPPAAGAEAAASFVWSPAKIRVAALGLFVGALPAGVAFALAGPFEQWLCLGWLAGIVVLLDGLGRRASEANAVLSVDARGIFDRRLMTRRIAWQEIAGICPVNVDRSHTIDIRLRWPVATLAGTRLLVRVGALCQIGYGVPAVTISMVLLDGAVADVLDAVAQYRPDLLHHVNRGLRLTASTP